MKSNFKEIFRLVRENKLATFGASICSLILAGSLVSAFAVEPQPQSITLSSEFGDIPASETVLTNVQITGVLTPTNIFPSVPLTEEQIGAGVTYEKKGVWQDAAVVIGEGAKGTIDPDYVAKTTGSTYLRSVSVAIGGHADAQVPDYPQSQAIAIGWFAQAKAGNAIAIGAGNQSTNETAMTGDATVAIAGQAVAIGYSAKATATDAVQIGKGTNSTKESFKFRDVFIVKDGKLAVDEPIIDTNTVNKIVQDAISTAFDPRLVETYDDESQELINVKSHTLTTISFTNTAELAGIEIEPSTTRNYDVFFPDTPTMREGLPIQVKVANTNTITRLGVWWDRKILRLPAMVKIQEPIKDMVLATVEEYPTVTKTDWTPEITNAVWVTAGNSKTINRLQGKNLHTLKTVELKYYISDTTTNTVTISEFQSALYGQAFPTMDAISADANIVSLEVTDYYTTFYKEGAK